MKKIMAMTFISGLVSLSAYADQSHYPYGNFSNAGEYAGTFSGDYYGEPIHLALKLDPSFSVAEKAIIKKSVGIFIKRALSEPVISCAYAHSSKDFKHDDEKQFVEELYNALKIRSYNDFEFPAQAFIANYWGEKDSVGVAYVDLFYKTDFKLPGYQDRHYFHIALNSDFIGPEGKYYYANDEEYWAGVIAHEFLHNLGFIHPTGYTGSFVKEYGKCVAANGLSKDMPFKEVPDIEVWEPDM